MAISLAAAALGSAVLGAGASVYSGSQQKKAANKALQAQEQAAQRGLADQQAARQRIEQLQSPFLQGGYGALSQIQNEYGLGRPVQPTSGSPQPATIPAGPALGVGSATPASGAQRWDLPPELVNYGGRPNPTGQTLGQQLQAPFIGAQPQPATIPAAPDTGGTYVPQTPGATPTGGVDYAQVLRDRPDVLAEYQRVAAVADPNSPRYQQLGLDRGPEGFAEAWYNTARNPADYTYQAPAAQAPAVASTPAPPTQDLPASVTQRPDQPQAPTFGPAPSIATYVDPNQFTTSPGYQFRLNEGLRNLNAGYGAKGLLKSGAAMQGVVDYSHGRASDEYGNWFSQGMQKYGADSSRFDADRAYGYNAFLNDRNNQNNNFENDRSYATNRYDTRLGNLFSLAQMGSGAAGAVGGANQTYANNAGNIYGSQANAAADAAYQRASANSQMVGSIAGIGSNIFGSLGNRPLTPFEPQTASNPFYERATMPASQQTFRPLPNAVF